MPPPPRPYTPHSHMPTPYAHSRLLFAPSASRSIKSSSSADSGSLARNRRTSSYAAVITVRSHCKKKRRGEEKFSVKV